jgi:hypothetical protein
MVALLAAHSFAQLGISHRRALKRMDRRPVRVILSKPMIFCAASAFAQDQAKAAKPHKLRRRATNNVRRKWIRAITARSHVESCPI